MRKFFCLTVAAFTFALCAAAGENLLRDDFTPDNIGGAIGWSANGSSLLRMKFTRLESETAGEQGGVRITWWNHRKASLRSTLRIPLVKGERFRISAQVRTHGLVGNSSCITMTDLQWNKGLGVDRLPDDTHGKWEQISWEGVMDLPSRSGDYSCIITAVAKESDKAWIDIRSLRLEGPISSNSLLADLKKLKPFPLRVSPVDPLLSEIRTDNAEMLFYCAQAADEFRGDGERKILRATAADRTVTVPFAADGHAKAVFGPMAPGKINLRAELVGADSGKVYASNDYRAFVREEIKGATPMKKLNNFVSELVRRPYADGDIAFTLAKETWMYVSLSDTDAKVDASFDGKPAKFYRDSGRLEIMRLLPRGSHVLSLKGAAKGELAVRALKYVGRSGMVKSEKMSPNFNGYNYGPEFFDAFELYGGMNMTSFGASASFSPEIRKKIDMFLDRGVQVCYSCGIGPRDSRRGVLENYVKYLTTLPSYKAGLVSQFDENSISMELGAVSKANTAEAWWRAYDDGRRIDIYLFDGATAIYSNPSLDIPELAAYVNSGDGTARLIVEAYYRSPENQSDFDDIVEFTKAQLKAMGEMVPAAPSRYVYLLNGWMMVGAWTSWYAPATDMRAFNAEMLRVLATDPAFADVGGAAFSTPGCYEDHFRFAGDMLRYYCIEGGTGSFAKMNGMEMWPRHIDNGDFTESFEGWTVNAAEPGSLARGFQRGTSTWYVRHMPGGDFSRFRKVVTPPEKRPGGDHFAVFTQSAKGPNILSRKITGLVPGRVYQLTCAVSDFASMNKGIASRLGKAVEPLNIPYMGMRVSGADEIPELRHVFGNGGAKGKACVFSHRMVFRAKSSEATVEFFDWKDSGEPAVAVGQKTILNYIGVYPYYYRDEKQLETLKRLTMQAKDMNRR